MLSELEQLLPCMSPTHPLHFHYCSVCARLRSDVGAQAALGEHADSALAPKNRWNAAPFEGMRSCFRGEEEERWEYDARSASRKRLVSDVRMVKTPSSFFRMLNMDMLLKGGWEVPAVPVPLSDHIRAIQMQIWTEVVLSASANGPEGSTGAKANAEFSLALYNLRL